jgi:hypothetical protein
MANFAAWFIFALGLGHIFYGLIKYKTQVSEVISAGFVGQFKGHEKRLTAFWFFIFGPLLMLAGHMAIHAVATGDVELLKIIGFYGFSTSLVWIAALPKSPFWAALIVSPLLIAAGYGLLR